MFLIVAVKGSGCDKIFRTLSISANDYAATEKGYSDNRKKAKSSKYIFFSQATNGSSAFLLISILSWIANAAVANFCQISSANITQFLVYQNHIHLSWSFIGIVNE